MDAKQVADFVVAQEEDIRALLQRVRVLEDGLRRIVTSGNEKASAMAWNILNDASNSNPSK